MSARDAAGWALSSVQSVSVVPTIQWLPQGMTNSTDFSVRRISPVSPLIRSRGTTTCTPLLARTWNRPRADQGLDVVGPHPRGVDDDLGLDVHLAPGLDVPHPDPGDPAAGVVEGDDLS